MIENGGEEGWNILIKITNALSLGGIFLNIGVIWVEPFT